MELFTRSISKAFFGRFRDALDSAAYNSDSIRDVVGEKPATVHRDQRWESRTVRRLENTEGPLPVLLRCFYFGQPVPLDELRAALPKVEPKDLLESALVTAEGASSELLVASVRLTPWRNMVLAHDPPERGKADPDIVTGVTAPTETLANLTVRTPASSVLDIGTGCGAQALLATEHSEHVVATDVNGRALWFTSLNAHLNARTSIECRKGPLFEPIREETFDLITCNPPYVISPESRFVYRDSGQTGDSFCQAVVSGIPSLLREGGFASILCNWICSYDDPWWKPLESWLDGTSCDAWLLHYATDDPHQYAIKWNAPLKFSNASAFDATIDRWMDFYSRERITAIASGAIILRKRSDHSNWQHKSEMPLGPSGGASEHIVRTFAAVDYLSSIRTPRDMLEHVFSLAGNHVLNQQLDFSDGEYRSRPIELRPSEGVGLHLTLEPHLVHLLLKLDGKRDLGTVASEIAALNDWSLHDTRLAIFEAIESLLEHGFLTVDRNSHLSNTNQFDKVS